MAHASLVIGILIALFTKTPSVAQTAPIITDIVATLRADLTRLQGEVASLTLGMIPAGAIAAFDLRGGCPPGWDAYERAASRVIVGAILEGREVSNRDERGNKLTPRKYGADGGEESHILTDKQLPEHAHKFRGTAVATGGWGFPTESYSVATGGAGKFKDYTPQGEIEKAGGKDPLNNMPPFIALHYCRKK